MSRKVLIVYKTRYGATEEVALKFREILEKNGFIVDLVDLKNQQNPNIAGYSGFILGSGIKMGRWTKEAKKFLKNNVKTINSGIIPVGIFLCSGEAANPTTRPEAIEKYLIKVFEEFGLKKGEHVIYEAFGGVYDLSESSKVGWFMKKMLNMAADDDPIMVRDQRIDARDWDQINAFISDFIQKFS